MCEFAAAELGVRIGRSTYAAAALMADALDLHHRHRQLWGRVEAGEVKASYARFVVAKTRDLTREQAAYVDAAVAESADGRIPWPRFEALVEAKVKAADPETARAKEEKASKATFAKKLRTEADGMGSFLIRADIATIDQLYAYVTAEEATLVEAIPEADQDTRRVHAVLLMANPAATPETDIARPAADRAAPPASYPGPTAKHRPAGGPRPGHRGLDHRVLGPRAGSRSPRSSTWTARRPWMPTRSPTDIDRPCI